MTAATEQAQAAQAEIELFEGELTNRFPISPFFSIKRSAPLVGILLLSIGLFLFGGPEYHAFRDNIMGSLGWKKPKLYYFACTLLLISVAYWQLYIWRFSYGVKDGILYIVKGVVIQNTFDYPITSIENIGVRRDFLDFLCGTCSVQIMTAHEDSDDLAAIRGIYQSQSRELHLFLRDLINSYQSSRHDIMALKRQVSVVGG